MLKLLLKNEVEEMFADIKKSDEHATVISTALAAGEIMSVNGNVYALVKTKEGRLKWRTDCIVHFPDKFVKRGIVGGHYRHIEHMVSRPRKYDGVKERITDFDIDNDNVLIKAEEIKP